MDNLTPSKIDLRYSRSRVVFVICDCSLNKNHSFYGLSKEEATKLIIKLKYFEKYEWRQFVGLSRDKGLTSESQGSESFDMIHQQNSSEQKMFEQYYFHFRIEQRGLFRVFGYQRGQFFCITHIDPRGKIHHT